jgi:enediyne biosynthesis protein E4
MGDSSNQFAVGSKVLLKQKDVLQFGYLNATKGFESSSLQYVHFGMTTPGTIDTLQVIWPSGRLQTLVNIKPDQRITVSYQPDSHSTNTLLPDAVNDNKLFTDITAAVNLPYKHQENNFNDFNVQALIPHTVSALGWMIFMYAVQRTSPVNYFSKRLAENLPQAMKMYLQQTHCVKM